MVMWLCMYDYIRRFFLDKRHIVVWYGGICGDSSYTLAREQIYGRRKEAF